MKLTPNVRTSLKYDKRKSSIFSTSLSYFSYLDLYYIPEQSRRGVEIPKSRTIFSEMQV